MEKTLEPTDLLWGPHPMAVVANTTTRKMQNMLTRKVIPARKVGHRYVISERVLREFLLGAPQRSEAA